MRTAYIGVGSNIGDPRRNCLDAIGSIGRLDDCKILLVSGLYLTEPVGIRDQEWFINGAVSISTGLTALDLIGKLMDIEADMGRVRTIKWGTRVIDLDILLFGQDVINYENLKVPHPMMHLRRFVMGPMADIAPDLKHPVLGKTMIELFREIPVDEQSIKRVEST